MYAFLFRRLSQSFLSLLLISLLVFTMMYAVGDPIAVLMPRSATEADREILRAELGLDRPLVVQYGMFLNRLAHGDFGRSYHHGRPVLELIVERIPATFELALVSLMLAMLIGIPLGTLAGARPDSWYARAAMGGSLLGISLPTFWLGLMLIMYFGVHLEWLPPMGRGPTRRVAGVEFSFLTFEGCRHLILPAITLALHHIAMLIRLVRSELFESLRQPFIRSARARGVSEASIVGRHAMRNSMIPILTVTAVEFGQLIAFSVVTETIFNWPGLGKLLIDSVYVDRPLVVAYLILTGTMFLALNFFVDVAYVLIDPRVRVHTPGAAGP